MTVVSQRQQRVVLPRQGVEPFWDTIHKHLAGADPHRWKCLAMLALRENNGWSLDQIGWAFGHSKGHVQRCITRIKSELRGHFDPPRNERDRCHPLCESAGASSEYGKSH